MLRLAASVGSRRPVEHYLRKGQDVNATDARGRTLLLIAAAKGHAQLCRLLIEAGADASLQDSDGIDALSAAIRNGRGEAEAVLRAFVSPALGASTDSTTAGTTADTDDGDLANWEELPESPPPADNAALRPDARRLQNRISRHAAIDTDDDWSDVDIELPDGPQRYQIDRAAWFNEVRDLMLIGLSQGFVTENRLAELVQRSDDYKRPDDEIESCLRVALGDMGFSVIDVPTIVEPLFRTEPSSGASADDGQQATVDDAIAFVAHLLSPHDDPVVRYYEDIKRMEAPTMRAIRRARAIGGFSSSVP